MPLSEDQIAAFELAVQRVVARDAAGWEVTFLRVPHYAVSPLRVDLTHPLSAGHRWFASQEHVETQDTTILEEIIAREPDFEHIAQAPRCPHEDLVRGLRDIAGIFYWRQAEVSTLAEMLHQAGCLTAEESEWLSRYGGREQRRQAAIQMNVFGRSDRQSDAPN